MACRLGQIGRRQNKKSCVPGLKIQALQLSRAASRHLLLGRPAGSFAELRAALYQVIYRLANGSTPFTHTTSDGHFIAIRNMGLARAKPRPH